MAAEQRLALAPLRRAVRALDRAAGWVDSGTQGIIMAVLAAIFVLMMAQVLLRYVIQSPVIWIEEAAAYLLPVLAVWGSAVCLRHRSHIAVDFIAARLPRLMQRLLAVLIYALIFYLALKITQAGFALVELGQREMATSGAFSLYWPRMSIVIGGALLMLQSFVLALRELFDPAPDGDRPTP
jgi:TRAP-type C4-dicarboxylate transport system permease small subunit